jgi:arylsulfatase A-like enzyme
MKAVMVMYDSLNRHYLPNYGCDWVSAPNFERLGEHSVTFDTSYVCSMPCMPARRDFHTGRPNFLHRSWGPLEPYDVTVPQLLRDSGVSSHFFTDHQHYFEPGGSNYHCQYDTWEFIRGQEGDRWKAVLPAPEADGYAGQNADPNLLYRQDIVNRQFMQTEEELPQTRTFRGGLDFLNRNHAADNWFLQIETFDPHEPFHAAEEYREKYGLAAYDEKEPINDWPYYRPVTESAEEIDQMRQQYAALVSMCDARLGEVLDAFDRHGLWDDTMLIVWTDHGFMLGEHNCWAKCWMPFYEEVAHTPFFVWDPRVAAKDERRSALVQPSIDLGPTLLDFFSAKTPEQMTGKDLRPVLESDESVREFGLFGMHGRQVNLTDGRHVYMRGATNAKNTPLYDYTLMPAHMRRAFAPEVLGDSMQLAEPFPFMQGCRPLKIDSTSYFKRTDSVFETSLYDLQTDPNQEQPIDDQALERKLAQHLVKELQKLDAPAEQYERLGLERV